MIQSEPIPDWIYKTDIRPFINYSPPVVDESEPFHQAVAALGRGGIGAVLVNKAGTRQLLGIITDRDLAKLEGRSQQDITAMKAKDLATTSDSVVAVRNDAPLWQFLRLINGENTRNRPFDHIPILDESKQIVGLVSRDQLHRQMQEFAR